MSRKSEKPCVICFNESVAQSLRKVDLTVFPEGEGNLERQVCDYGPAIYLHAPEVVVAAPAANRYAETVRLTARWPARPDDKWPPPDLRQAVGKVLESAGARPVPNVPPLPPTLKPSLTQGAVLGVVFVEKVPVDVRLRAVGRDLMAALARARAARRTDYCSSSAWLVTAWQGYLHPPPSSEVWRKCLVLPECVETYTPESLEPLVSGLRFELVDPPFHAQARAVAWAENLLPKSDLSVPVVVKPDPDIEATGKALAERYGVAPAHVTLEPLFVNNVGDWLGVAVRIGKGAVLVLPEFPDKAAVVKRLATELWEDVQAWLGQDAEASKSVLAAPPSPVQVEPSVNEADTTMLIGVLASHHKYESSGPGAGAKKYENICTEPLTVKEIAKQLDWSRDRVRTTFAALPGIESFEDYQRLTKDQKRLGRRLGKLDNVVVAADAEHEDRTAALVGEPKCVQKAYWSWRRTIDSMPPNDETPTKTPTDDMVYDWLVENPTDGYELPDRRTWKRYARRARKITGEQKNKRRAGRGGPSILRQDELGQRKPS